MYQFTVNNFAHTDHLSNQTIITTIIDNQISNPLTEYKSDIGISFGHFIKYVSWMKSFISINFIPLIYVCIKIS